MINDALVNRDLILMPPLHIKLGLVKQFIKSLNESDAAFIMLKTIFPKHTPAKLKGRIFTGPDIRKMFKSREFQLAMTEKQRRAWEAFGGVVNGFLGNKRAEDYVELIDNLIDSYRLCECRMSIKMHYLHSHLDFFLAQTWGPLVKSTGNASTKTFGKWKGDIRGDGTRL